MERGLATLSFPGDLLQPGRAKVTGLAPNTNCTFQVAAVTRNRLVGMFSNTVTAVTLQDGKIHFHEEKVKNDSFFCSYWISVFACRDFSEFNYDLCCLATAVSRQRTDHVVPGVLLGEGEQAGDGKDGASFWKCDFAVSLFLGGGEGWGGDGGGCEG